MDYSIDYSDASNRQEIIGIYSLYFYIVTTTAYAFEVGNLVISLLIYMVEEGRLNAYAMKVYEIKTFIYEYLKGIDFEEEYNLDEIAENLISKLQGAKPNGDPIKFEYYDHEIRTRKSVKIAYIDYSLKDEGFKITDKGLEFLISSKEIPQEAKLTVALYLFKLQLEKKKYRAALNTIKNINLETMRQLDVKNEILSMNRYGRDEASRLYKKYWGDFFELRNEETSHYEGAKERLELYKETEYLENNNIKLTPEDIEVLKAIEMELGKSSNLQAVYTNEISKMPVEMLEIDKSSMINIFLTLFNLKEHFEELSKVDTPIEAFLNSIQPLLLPKRSKRFGLTTALSGQKVSRHIDIPPAEEINIKTQKHEDYEMIFEGRMKNNYLKLFEILIEYLIRINQEIEDISEFVTYVEQGKGNAAITSIDLLSFLLSLSYLPDAQIENTYGAENTQVISLNEKRWIKDKPIEVFQVQELLTFFWFDKLKMNYNAEIHVSTEPKKKIQINGDVDRSIGNIRIRLIEKGSMQYG
ncbi:hypothetical protein Q5O24_09605 [Eubacteriaceae bacterium ES3]|nr:hypothetical protein Q5O24_09605 [Eubacteriaceae bacterium ES3]